MNVGTKYDGDSKCLGISGAVSYTASWSTIGIRTFSSEIDCIDDQSIDDIFGYSAFSGTHDARSKWINVLGGRFLYDAFSTGSL